MTKLRFFTYIILLYFLCVPYTIATEQLFEEYQIKAVYLFNFAHFVTWPQQAFSDEDSPIHICIIGNDPFKGLLEKAVKGETVGQRSISVEYRSNTKNLTDCHILFVSKSEMPRVPTLLNQISDKPVLTVGDDEHFAEQGGIINFTWDDDVVHLMVNIRAMRKAGLEISFKLLQLATVIGEDADAD